MAYLGAILAVAGTVLQADAQSKQGAEFRRTAARRQQEANFEASQLDQDAQQAVALSHREVQNAELQTKLFDSTALARAAASGTDVSSRGISDVRARIGAMGSYKAGVAMYEGEAQARLDKIRAQALRMTGDIGVADAVAASGASNRAAGATLLSGLGKTAALSSKYWDSPKASPTALRTQQDNSWLDAGSDQIGDVA